METAGRFAQDEEFSAKIPREEPVPEAEGTQHPPTVPYKTLLLTYSHSNTHRCHQDTRDYQQSLPSPGNGWSSAGACCPHAAIFDTRHGARFQVPTLMHHRAMRQPARPHRGIAAAGCTLQHPTRDTQTARKRLLLRIKVSAWRLPGRPHSGLGCAGGWWLPCHDTATALLPACLHGRTDLCPCKDTNLAEHLPWSIVPRSILMTAPGPSAPPDHASQPPRNKMHQIPDIFQSDMAAHRAPEVAEAHRNAWASMDRERQ